MDYQKFLTDHPAVSTITEGLGRGFLLYFLPMAVLKREVKKKVLRRALAIGGFCSVVRLIRYYTQNQNENEKKYFEIALKKNNNVNIIKKIQAYVLGLIYKYPCHVAGAVGGLCGVILDPTLAESQLFAIWLLVRAIRCITPHIPFASTFTMCLSASQILSSYARAPKELDGAYYKFLKIHGGLPKENLHVLLTKNDIKNLCTITHPGKTCKKYLFGFFFEEFQRAMRVYVPLYVVFFIFSRSKNIKFLVENLLRSSAFLAAYCTLAWGSGCLFHRIFPNTFVSRKSLFFHTFVSGLATLIERRNRRNELAAYCATYALDSIMKSITASDTIPEIPYFTPFIFCIALAILVKHRKQQPWIFSHFMLGDEHKSKKNDEE